MAAEGFLAAVQLTAASSKYHALTQQNHTPEEYRKEVSALIVANHEAVLLAWEIARDRNFDAHELMLEMKK